MKSKIKLAHAHVTQLSGNKGKGVWSIQENITDDVLGELPSTLTDNQVFSILHFARKFELEAFNTGITFGKEEYKKVFESTINEYKYKLEQATNENERIAEALDISTRSVN